MNRNKFLELFIEKNDIETDLTEDTKLEDIEEWDSLAAVTTIALFYKELGIKINASNIKECNTVKDILDLGIEKYE
ncbi:MAG: acyl carrier protein [Candidatus Gastranaerophilaceae bacterium]